jgi:2-iminobutanoate/2-iminopropanoate deaminase
MEAKINPVKETKMKKVIIESKKVFPPIGPFSQAVMKGNMIFVAGTVGVDRQGALPEPSNIKTQTRRTFENIKALLEEAGSKIEDVVKLTIFLKDVADYKGMNEVRAEFFPRNPPVSSAIAITDFMLPGLLVEIEAIAITD